MGWCAGTVHGYANSTYQHCRKTWRILWIQAKNLSLPSPFPALLLSAEAKGESSTNWEFQNLISSLACSQGKVIPLQWMYIFTLQIHMSEEFVKRHDKKTYKKTLKHIVPCPQTFCARADNHGKLICYSAWLFSFFLDKMVKWGHQWAEKLKGRLEQV